MLALLHAVFAWQAQLGGRGEEAALEAVQGELAGLFRKERLLVVGVPPLVPAGRPPSAAFGGCGDSCWA